MGRPPNFLASQWSHFSTETERRRNAYALCAEPEHRLLPWTAEPPIDDRDIAAMEAVCNRCPVIGECAFEALNANRGRGVTGGFYAGVWLPWVNRNSVMSTKVERQRKREVLRRTVKEWKERGRNVQALGDRRA
jgi:hypothetical protein